MKSESQAGKREATPSVEFNMAALFIGGNRALRRLLVTRSHTLMAKKTDPESLKSNADSVVHCPPVHVFLCSYMQTIRTLSTQMLLRNLTSQGNERIFY